MNLIQQKGFIIVLVKCIICNTILQFSLFTDSLQLLHCYEVYIVVYYYIVTFQFHMVPNDMNYIFSISNLGVGCVCIADPQILYFWVSTESNPF